MVQRHQENVLFVFNLKQGNSQQGPSTQVEGPQSFLLSLIQRFRISIGDWEPSQGNDVEAHGQAGARVEGDAPVC